MVDDDGGGDGLSTDSESIEWINVNNANYVRKYSAEMFKCVCVRA